MRLISIKKSDKTGKKYVATFENSNTGRQKHVHFGASGYEDYTMHHDKSRRASYWRRHSGDNILKADSPGALSLIVLWGPSTSLKENIKTYKRLYGV